MLKYLENLRGLFSIDRIESFNNWIISNPVNYATKLCEHTVEMNIKTIETRANWNSSQFWKEELKFDSYIEKEVRDQDLLRKHIQHLIDEYASKDLKTSKLSDEDLIEIAREIASLNIHLDIISDINAFQVSQKREKYFRRQKGHLLKRKRNSLINFRDVFRQLYSFHFKNLDDEHDLAYTNLRMIS